MTQLISGLLARRLRIASGLVLLGFVTCHLINASFGIHSVAAMDAARPYLTGIWTSNVLSPVILVAALLHFVLGLLAIYQRPTLRTNAQDVVQILSSVCIVPLAAQHAVGTMMSANAGMRLGYDEIIRIMWVDQPGLGLLQVIMLTVVWVHGCAGFLTWLRSAERARNVLPWIYPLAVAIPIAALLGFSEAGRSALASANAPKAYGQSASYGGGGYGAASSGYESGASDYDTPSEEYGASDAPQVDFERILGVIRLVSWWSIGLAALTFLARALRLYLHPTQTVQLSRNSQTLAASQSGLSLLDMFRQANAPHASLCEGRGRCGTCALRVISSDFPLPEPDEIERRTLHARNLPDRTRLACRLFPDGGQVTVEALFPPDYTFHDSDEITQEATSETPA